MIVLDLSASGALLEGSRPLPPGARIEVHLWRDAERFVVTAQVVRCLVAAIDPEQGITYHAALSFEDRFHWLCEEETLSVSLLPDDERCGSGRSVQQIPPIDPRVRHEVPEYSK